MRSFLPYIFLFVLLASSALGAPKEGDEKKAEEKSSSAADKKEVSVVDDSWLSIFTNNPYAIGTLVAGVVVLLAGVGVFAYYYTYVYAYHNTEATNYQGQPNYYNPSYPYGGTGRALDLSNYGYNWNSISWAKVLDYIDLAQKTYEGFDWQNLECQKRALCELSRDKSTAFGESAGRAMSNNYLLSFVDVLDDLPIPRIIQTYLNEYKEAISSGRSIKKECGELYAKCKFSIARLIDNLKKKE